jgi:hypothetical protein
MSNATITAPIFTSAAHSLEDGDELRIISSLVRVRGVFDETPGYIRLVVQHIENLTGDPARDVYTIVVPSAKVFEVYAAADVAA